jgi:acid stress chaperone HdeB
MVRLQKPATDGRPSFRYTAGFELGGRVTMRRLTLTIATTMLALAPWTGAGAQVTVDVAKITCDQFTLFKITDPKNIAIWLSGYYHGQRNTTTIDTQALNDNLRKITDYCNLRPQETVMNAVEKVFGPLK